MVTSTSQMDHPLKPVCELWQRKLEDAKKIKHERFGQYADEAMRFFDGAHDWMWADSYSKGSGGFLDKDSSNLPTFRMTVNRVFEAVALFGPTLFHKYPNVMVTPVNYPEVPLELLGLNPADPQQAKFIQQKMQQKQMQQMSRGTHAGIFQHYLNWLQIEGNKKREIHHAVTEAIVKGLGLLRTDLYQPPGSRIRYPRSTYLSVDDYVVDPDAEYEDDIQWIAIRHLKPVNITEDVFGLPKGELFGQIQSKGSQATKKGKKDAKSNKQGSTSFDLIEYWEIFSKNGFGDKLRATDRTSPKSKFDFSVFGDYTYIVVAKDVPYPLNMPSWSLQEDADSVFERSQWPIPFWTETNGWPVSRLHFYEKPKSVWPISLVKPAIGELRFVNWCMSFLADKVATSSTTYVGVLKEAAMDIQEQVQGKNAPFTVLEISQITGTKLKDVISFMQAPDVGNEIWKMVTETLDLIDKRMGTTELLYGLSAKQHRSATESKIKDENTSIRPDEMASRTDDFLGQTNIKEAEVLCWKLGADDVLPVLGEDATRIFEEQILTQDFEKIVRDFSYRIEAGSARKPNKANRISSLNEFAQVALPTIQALALEGQPAPWNALMREMAKAMDFDASEFLIQPPQPEEEGPSPEELEMEIKRAELEMKGEEHEQDMEQDAETHTQEMKQMRAKSKVEISTLRARSRAMASSNGNRS